MESRFQKIVDISACEGGRSPLFHETTVVTYSYGLESGLILCLRTSTKKFVRPCARFTGNVGARSSKCHKTRRILALEEFFGSNSLSVRKFYLVLD